jgi:hypothetical protein
MVINEEVKAVIEGSGCLSLVTVGADGTPHPIVAGKGDVVGDTVVFGIYKMEITQKNLSVNDDAWVVAATMDNGPKGYRLIGTAKVRNTQLIFTPVKVEALM